jgi:hypothetical protein
VLSRRRRAPSRSSSTAVEAAAYFVVAEALTNVAKHARAGHAGVTARIEDGTVQVRVRDDGVGGARPDGSGLVGLADRLTALGGKLRIDSPAEGGTLVAPPSPSPANRSRGPVERSRIDRCSESRSGSDAHATRHSSPLGASHRYATPGRRPGCSRPCACAQGGRGTDHAAVARADCSLERECSTAM